MSTLGKSKVFSSLKTPISLYSIMPFRIWLPVFTLLDILPDISLSVANMLPCLRAVQAHNYLHAWRSFMVPRLNAY